MPADTRAVFTRRALDRTTPLDYRAQRLGGRGAVLQERYRRMSDFHMSVHAFDILDAVAVTLYVYDLDNPSEDGRLALGAVGTFQGEGETDAAQWTRDVAIWILERV
jgi:hypothetical protein